MISPLEGEMSAKLTEGGKLSAHLAAFDHKKRAHRGARLAFAGNARDQSIESIMADMESTDISPE